MVGTIEQRLRAVAKTKVRIGECSNRDAKKLVETLMKVYHDDQMTPAEQRTLENLVLGGSGGAPETNLVLSKLGLSDAEQMHITDKTDNSVGKLMVAGALLDATY